MSSQAFLGEINYKGLCLLPCFRLSLYFMCYRILTCDLLVSLTTLPLSANQCILCLFILVSFFTSAEAPSSSAMYLFHFVGKYSVVSVGMY